MNRQNPPGAWSIRAQNLSFMDRGILQIKDRNERPNVCTDFISRVSSLLNSNTNIFINSAAI